LAALVIARGVATTCAAVRIRQEDADGRQIIVVGHDAARDRHDLDRRPRSRANGASYKPSIEPGIWKSVKAT
jgi:hypothetical protein